MNSLIEAVTTFSWFALILVISIAILFEAINLGLNVISALI